MLSKVKKGVELGRKLGQPAKKPPIKASEALGKHEGKTLMITEADRTKVGEGYLGGPGFSSLQLEDPFYRDVGAVWGVGKPSKASTMIAANKRLPEGEVIWSTFIGKPDQHKSNQMVFDSLLKEFKAANKAGNLSDELKDKINDRLASAVDKDGRPIFPADVDITSPKFRNLANTFDRRAVAASVMGGEGVGGKKGQIFDYESIIKSTTDPDLVEAPTGAVGNRLFTLSNEVIQRPDLHPAFPSILTGEDLDVNFSPVLRDLIMRDYIKSMMETKGRMPGQFDYTRGYAPMQLLDEAILTKMQKEGYAEGGAIDHDLKAWHEKNMASGGIVKLGKAVARAAKKSTLPAFGGSYDNSVVKRAKEEFMTTHGMDVGQSLSKDYDFVDLEKIKPAEKVSKKRVEALMNALENEDPFNTKIPPVIIDSDGNVLDGHHRIEAAKRLGIKSVPAIEKFETQSGTKLVDNFEQGRAKGGAIDHDLKAWHEKTMAEGGAVGSPEGIPPLAMDLESDYQAYAAGGEVRMSNGGSSEYEGFFESGLPPESPAKDILVGRGVRRKEPRIGEIFETPAQAVQGALGAFGSAGKGALQATVGLPGDIISLGRGVGAAVSPQPGEDRLGAFLRGMEGETGLPTTEDVKKFLDQYGKAPFEQFETLGEFTGIPILAAPKVSGAIGRAAEDVAPYLRDLPVGASTKPVGQTTEEWLKSLEIPPKPQGSKMKVYAPADDLGLYSKMEKAALNFKRKEGTGDAWLADFKNAGVSDEELEFSGMKDVLARITQPMKRETIAVYAKQRRMPLQAVRATEGTDAGDFKFREAEVIDDTDYIKSRAEDIEADFDNEYPGGTDALRARIMRDFTDEELNDPHILASIDETVERNKKQEAYDRAYTEYYDNPYYRSYNDAGYEIVGNRDIGFTVKDPNGQYLTRNRALGSFPAHFNSLEIAESFANQHALDTGLMRESDVKYSKYQLDRGTDYEEMKIILPQPPGKRSFHSDHWEDEEDVLSHYRTQRRVDTAGKEMLYVDEIQSDWHQAGRDYGYFTKEDQIEYDKISKRISNLDAELMKVSKERSQLYRAKEDSIKKQILDDYRSGVKDESEIDISMIVKRFDELPEVKDLEKKETDLYAQRRGIIEERQKFAGKVPDAPFKDTWHELTVKTILHDAAQKGFERVGFSAAKPHIDRWGTEVFAWEKVPKMDMSKEAFTKWAQDKFAVTPDESLKADWDNQGTLYQAYKQIVDESGGWNVVSQEQRGGQAGGVNLEAEARARGILKGKTGQEIKTRDDLKQIVEDTLRDPTELKVERITNKVWKSMNRTDVGIHEPRKEGMQFFYDEALKKFLEKYADKIGGRFYETETKTGRGVSEEGPKDITEKVYMFEFTPEAKDTAVKGQPYKKGGLVKKDDKLIRWHKVQQLAAGGAIKRLAESAKDKPWMKYAKSDKDKR